MDLPRPTILLALPACLWLLLPSPASAADAPPDTASAPSFVVFEGDTLWLAPELEVVGSRVPVSLPGLVRHVTMLGDEALDRLPGRSAPGLLQTVPGVVTGQRQIGGVQSDLTIRGSTFEQVQVLLDGYDLADPQTGHHLMDLPLGRHDIARLEVLPGHGSALYGSGAFGGTVNVVTRRPSGRTGGELGLIGGGLDTRGAWGSLDLAAGADGATALRASAETFRTDGHVLTRDDGSALAGANDAEVTTGTLRLVTVTDAGEGDVFAGYAERDFGATGFYAPVASRERTRTWFAAARWNRRVAGGLTLEPRLHARRHTDRFVLYRDDPDRYANDHETRRVAGELRAIAAVGEGLDLAVGLEGVYEDIASSGVRRAAPGGPVTAVDALGDRVRRRLSVSAELDERRGAFTWQLGGRLDDHQRLATRVSGTAAAALALPEGWTVRAGAGNVHRVPTFTDLYYEDAFSRGDPELAPEEGWTWDVGVERETGPWRWRAAWFERHESDLIDWARPRGGTGPWQAMNVADGKVQGLESAAGWRHSRGHALDAGWTWLDKTTSLPDGYEARYALLVPRHVLTASGTASLPWALALTVAGRYLARNDGPDDFRHAFVLDARLEWRHAAGWFAGLQGTNLTDRRVMEVPGVPLPGALVTASAGRGF